MQKLRTIDEHVQLYTAFAHAIAGFDITIWNDIRARCAAIDEATVFGAFERAQIRAIPLGYPTSQLVANTPGPFGLPFRLLGGVSAVVHTGLAFGFELTQLMPGMREATSEPVLAKSITPRAARFAEAHYRLNHTLDSLKGRALGVRAAIQAAADAVFYHDFLSDVDFAVSYAVVAPVLSFAELERRAIGV